MLENQGPRLTILGQLIALLFIAGCGFGAWFLFAKKPVTGEPSASGSQPSSSDAVEIGIAYGTEKERWLQWAVEQFAQHKDGKRIKVNLIPKGSKEGADAILAGDEKIHVWSPGSALYKDFLAQEWKIKHGKPILEREEALALSPMVFVMWAERYEAYIAKYKELSFDTIAQALKEPGGWGSIAQKPEWGLFKFGHAHPSQSNSGLMTLLLMAFDFHKKSRGLSMEEVIDPKFQAWMNGIETAATGLSKSTGTMMRDMVLRGPSSYDALCVYESVVIDYLKSAEGRWGELRVAYPRLNMWNDMPYYVLDAPWCSAGQRKAAGVFLDFLLSEPVQRESLKYGFRPANTNVAVKFPESPFVQYARFGLQIDLANVGEAPKSEVINNLLLGWQRSQGNR